MFDIPVTDSELKSLGEKLKDTSDEVLDESVTVNEVEVKDSGNGHEVSDSDEMGEEIANGNDVTEEDTTDDSLNVGNTENTDDQQK